MNAEQAWRLLTNNMPAAGQADLTVSGDDAITAILLRTRAIVGASRMGLTEPWRKGHRAGVAGYMVPLGLRREGRDGRYRGRLAAG
jgi:hypothetical protein